MGSHIHPDIVAKLCELLRHIEVETSKDWSRDDISKTICVNALADRMNMSVRSLTSYFKLYTGESLGKYIASRRAEYAARLFRLFPNVSTSEVSRINGFFNPPALYSFLKKYGVGKPSDLRKPTMSDARLPYRKQVLDSCLMVFKLRHGLFDDCNSVAFEVDNWQAIETAFPNVPPLACIGIAIDNYLDDDIHCGTFMAGILYRESMKIPHEFGTRKMPKCSYAVFTHTGAYTSLPEFYSAVFATIQHSTAIYVDMASPIFENYLNSPADTAAEELITELWIPLRN